MLADNGIGIDGNLGDILEAAFAAHLAHQDPALPDVSYADDSAFVMSCIASSLADVTGLACCIIKSVFTKYGLPMNFGKGKSEVVLGIHGENARSTWREVMIDRGGRIQHAAFETQVDILVSASYKHLGSMMAANGSMAVEITARIAATWAVVRSLRAQFYKAADVSGTVKTKTVHPLLWSRLC